MLIKVVGSFLTGKLHEFEALLEVLGQTVPAPDAAMSWVLCVLHGILLLDLRGRIRAADDLCRCSTPGPSPSAIASRSRTRCSTPPL